MAFTVPSGTGSTLSGFLSFLESQRTKKENNKKPGKPKGGIGSVLRTDPVILHGKAVVKEAD